MNMPDAASTLGTTFEDITAKLNLWNVAYILLIIVAAVVVSRVVLSLVGRALAKSKLDPALTKVVKSVVKFIVGVVCILLICETLGIEITSLIALFSVVGLAFSLAIQGVLANLAGGITILGARPFRVGDFVEMDGVTGTVKEVALMYTKVDTTDNRLVYIPNKIVSEAKVVNFTQEGTRRIELTFSAAYTCPVERVKGALLEAITHTPGVLTDPAPLARVGGYGASAIEYHVRAWCAAADYWDVYYGLHEEIKAAFDRSGVEMTYDHLNVHVLEDKQKA